MTSEQLQMKLEALLASRLSECGSTLYKLTWKPWTTPSGRSRFRLRASARRTSETVCTGSQVTGWATPNASFHDGDPQKHLDRKVRAGVSKNPVITDLSMQAAALTGWPTTTTRDWKDGAQCDNVPTNALLGRTVWLTTAQPCLIRLTASGDILTGSSVATASGAQLNPALSAYLMGLPEAWERSAPGWQDWRAWQDLMQQASSEPKRTE